MKPADMCSIKRRRSVQQLETQETAGDCITTHYIYYSRPWGISVCPGHCYAQSSTNAARAVSSPWAVWWQNRSKENGYGNCPFFGLIFFFSLIHACWTDPDWHILGLLLSPVPLAVTQPLIWWLSLEEGGTLSGLWILPDGSHISM